MEDDVVLHDVRNLWPRGGWLYHGTELLYAFMRVSQKRGIVIEQITQR